MLGDFPADLWTTIITGCWGYFSVNDFFNRWCCPEHHPWPNYDFWTIGMSGNGNQRSCDCHSDRTDGGSSYSISFQSFAESNDPCTSEKLSFSMAGCCCNLQSRITDDHYAGNRESDDFCCEYDSTWNIAYCSCFFWNLLQASKFLNDANQWSWAGGNSNCGL